MNKKDQNKYLASLKEYRDWYAVLNTAESKGIQKGLDEAKEKIEKALKEKKEALKREEKALEREEKERKEKERAKKALFDTVKLLLSMNTDIKKISEVTGLSEKEIKEIKENIK